MQEKTIQKIYGIVRKLLRTKTKADFVVTFYKSVIIFIFLFGAFLILLGFFLSNNYFLKFTINERLTSSALQKIKVFKIFLVIAGLAFLLVSSVIKYYKNITLRFIARKKKILQNLTLLFLTVFILIVSLELSLRLVLTQDSKYNFAPGVQEFYEKYVFLNKDGYRDIDSSYFKQKNTKRIVGLGDSFTFGTGIKNVNDTYLEELESLLNEKSEYKKYEVLNFGKAGVDSEFEVQILKNDALRYNPDIIIVGFVLNDFRDFEYQKKGGNFYLFWFDTFLKRYSYLYNFVNKGFNIALEAAAIKKSYYQTILDSFKSEKNKKLNEEYFKEFKKISRENNSTLVIAIFPFIHQLDKYPFAEQHKVISQMANENGIIIIDLLPYFKGINEKKLVVSKFDNHPNELGHRIAAEAIYEKLINLKLVH
ncbi:MAG: SGNH/GDSL hydrolase family protein [Nanoarchaeota archaeon]